MIDIEELNQAADATYESITRLADQTIPMLVEHYKDNREVLTETLLLHRKLIKLMQAADSMIETALIDAKVAFGGETISGHMVNIRRTGAKTVYDNAAITSRIAAVIAIDVNEPDENGEILDRRAAAEKAVMELANLVGTDNKSFTGWRKGVAKDRFGVDLDKYQTKEGGRLKVEITE